MAVNRDIQYLNRDFSDFRSNLINYTRTYFPTTYNDFSPASPGMLFMEMASYVGDVLSFYLDNQIQENYLQFARQTNNLYQLAYMFGYKPKVTGAASAQLTFYQRVPAKPASPFDPDYSYALFIPANSTIVGQGGTTPFVIEDAVDFTVNTFNDPTEVTVYQADSYNNPTYYLLKKTVKATSGGISTTTFTFGAPQRFSTVTINAEDIIGIVDAIDSDGNSWYEVDYLGQDMVYEPTRNTNINDPQFTSYADTPYILKLKQVQRRFVSRFLNSNTLQIQFGAGNTGDTDENIIPNPDNIGIGLPFGQSKLTTAYDPTNFIFTNTYGIAPSNTTITIRYLSGGGATANVPANTLTILNTTPIFLQSNLDPTTANDIFTSLQVTNLEAASGGADGDTVEELRQNSIANFNAQLRAVTPDDYLIRILSMPAKYGAVAKAFVTPTTISEVQAGEIPSVLDAYVLAYNSAGQLTQCSEGLKQNIINSLQAYRMIGDTVKIKDAFIINIGINFEIITSPNYNSSEVLTRCITELKNQMQIQKWQINQPIILREIYKTVENVKGVQNIKTLEIANKAGLELGYSQYAYDLKGATLGGVIYPSLDPSIFEVRYPDIDIMGKVVAY